MSPKTKIEAFLGQKGTLLIRDSYRPGKINTDDFTYNTTRVGLSALTVYKPGEEKSKSKGLQVVVESYSSLGTYDHVCYLDYDEVKSLSLALAYIANLIPTWNSKDIGLKDATFATTGDFSLRFFHDQDNKQYVYVTCNDTTAQLKNVTGVVLFKSAVDDAIAWLDKQ